MKTLHTSGKVRTRLMRSKDFLTLNDPMQKAISRLLKTSNIKAITLADLTNVQLLDTCIKKASKNEARESVLKPSPIL